MSGFHKTPNRVISSVNGWKDVRHQISVDPADHARIHIGDLKEVVDLRVTGSTAAVDHLPHPPILLGLLSGLKVVLDDDRHPWGHVQEHRPV